MEMVIGGFTIDRKVGRQQLNPVRNPEAGIIDDYIELCSQKDGVLSIRVEPTPGVVTTELILYTESKQYLLMVNEIGDDGEVNVRTLYSPYREDALVNILGEPYPNRDMTDDPEVVRQAFHEFINTGSVSLTF